MEKVFADLHVHSYFSDGSLSPKELVKAAHENGVGLIALADHNMLEGSQEFKEECSKYDIRCIPAVEIDSLDGDTNFHILAYGFDEHSCEFIDFIKHTRFLLDELSVKLVELMQRDYTDLSISDFMDYTYNRQLGGWKALHYFVDKGLTSSLKDGIKFYEQFGLTYDKSGYSTISAIAYRIKKVGGMSVLAHPGELIDSTDIESFRNEMLRIVSLGLDGIECYYPTHSDAVTKVCLEICSQNNLLITAGSDCHGVFGKTNVGEMKITLDKLELKELLAL